MSNLKIVTVATETKYYYPYLKETIKNNNNELVVLGMGEKWMGFSWKFELMINYLETLNPDDIVCFVDGYDVICLRNLNELPNIFFKIKKETGCKIIVSSEKQVYIIHKILAALYFGKCKNSTLNSGSYIGLAKDLLEILYDLYKKKDPLEDDQKMLIKYCNKNPNLIYIDNNNKLFLSINHSYNNIQTNKEILIKDNQLYYNNNKPFFLHGYGNTYMDNILKKIGYGNVNVSKEISDGFKNDIYFKMTSFLYNMLINKIFLAIIISILLVSLIYYFRNDKTIKKYNILKKLYKYKT